MSSGSPTSNVQLSYSGYEFLTTIFDKYDADKDKALNSQVRPFIVINPLISVFLSLSYLSACLPFLSLVSFSLT